MVDGWSIENSEIRGRASLEEAILVEEFNLELSHWSAFLYCSYNHQNFDYSTTHKNHGRNSIAKNRRGKTRW